MEQQNNTMIRIEALTKTYAVPGGTVDALKGIDLEIRQGEIFGIIGMSGAGKSTLIRCMNLLERPTSGTIQIDGQDVTGLSKKALRQMRHSVGMIFQQFNLLMQTTVEKNIAFPLEITGVDKAQCAKRVKELLEIVGLSDKADAYPAQLSGGMRQRAALLRTYLFSGSVALLDEPFSALDMLTKQSVHGWYLDVMEQIRLSTLFITHDIDEAVLLSDRIYLLTGKPGTITGEIVIKEPKPRAKDFQVTEAFLEAASPTAPAAVTREIKIQVSITAEAPRFERTLYKNFTILNILNLRNQPAVPPMVSKTRSAVRTRCASSIEVHTAFDRLSA